MVDVFKNNTAIPHAIIITITMFPLQLNFSLSVICPSAAVRDRQMLGESLKWTALLETCSSQNWRQRKVEMFARSLLNHLWNFSALCHENQLMTLHQRKKVINKSCPPSVFPCMPVLLSHGCNFPMQTFRLTKHRFPPAGNAKRFLSLAVIQIINRLSQICEREGVKLKGFF